MNAALLPDAQGIFEVAARVRLVLPLDTDAIRDVSPVLRPRPKERFAPVGVLRSDLATPDLLEPGQ